MNVHEFVRDPVNYHRCARCGDGRSALSHRVPDPPRTAVTVEAVLDLEHLVLGQRVLIDGEPYEVAEVQS